MSAALAVHPVSERARKGALDGALRVTLGAMLVVALLVAATAALVPKVKFAAPAPTRSRAGPIPTMRPVFPIIPEKSFTASQVVLSSFRHDRVAENAIGGRLAAYFQKCFVPDTSLD